LAPGGRPSQSYAPGLVVASGTVIDPLVESLTPTFNGNSISLVPMTAAQAAEVPASLQPPVSLTFSTTPLAVGGVPLLQGNVVVDTGALIELQPNAQSSVTIKGDTVAFGGQVIVPGGLINVSGASNSAQVTVDLEPGSLLSAQGQTQLSANTFGYKTGTVLNGGTVNVSGNIVGEAGAVIDVSGWQDTLQVLPGSAGTTSSGLSEVNLVPTVEDSNGGSITLAGGELLWNDATLLGTAGGSTGQTTAAGLAFGHSTAGGGTLKVSSGSVNGELPSDVNLTVVQSDSSLPALSTPIIGGALVDAGYVTADRSRLVAWFSFPVRLI
jgi:hypothetical protein